MGAEGLQHVPVLAAEVVEALSPSPGETYIDCTAGLGGHAEVIATRIGSGGTVLLLDADEGNLRRAEARLLALAKGPKVIARHANFAEAERLAVAEGLAADMVLADLGFASTQVDDASRGLSFGREGPLDMRLDPTAPLTAADLLNELPVDELTRIIRDWGEERHAPRVARAIDQARERGPIRTTTELAKIVRGATGGGGRAPGGHRGRGGGIDPATRTFQALRIAVNDELGALASLLASVERGAIDAATPPRDAAGWLSPGARVAVISFHSLEDRPVKQAFASLSERELAERITRKPVTPGEAEVARNPRSRSAKLRAVCITGGAPSSI